MSVFADSITETRQVLASMHSYFTILININAKDHAKMINICSRAICRKASLSSGARGSSVLRSTTLDTRAHQFHHLGTVRHLNIRHVITQKKPSEMATTKKSTPRANHNDQSPKQHSPEFKSSSSEKRDKAALQHHDIHSLGRIDADKWRSNLVLPPDAFWKKWRSALRPFDAGGLDTAVAFVDRWKLELPKISFAARKHDFPTADRKHVFQCTSQISLALLGVRKVVSYGYSKVRVKLQGRQVCGD